MHCVPAGLEALPVRARLLCHQWSTLVSVGASAARRRAPPVGAAHGSRCSCRTRVDAAAARCYMTRTADALRASWSGGAAGACPAALPSVEHLSKCESFNCASTCTTMHELIEALDARAVPE